MQSRIFKLGFLALLFGTMLTSCELVGDIFQAGMGVGIFIVIAVIVLIIWVISRFRK
ncbi:hypothetical protein [Flavobacterium suzhouense]|uniref:Phosphatidate cytidylyltransferase n=1 Tax=Flavobacterium suzhouense TaxID=1529638 RepID=A0ABW5NYC3_9FLAO